MIYQTDTISNGVKQGGCMSTALFSTCLDKLLGILRKSNVGCRHFVSVIVRVGCWVLMLGTHVWCSYFGTHVGYSFLVFLCVYHSARLTFIFCSSRSVTSNDIT